MSSYLCAKANSPGCVAELIEFPGEHSGFFPPASNRQLMAHRMKSCCVFSVFHCLERAFDAASRATPES